ncbi:restriction endonuclease subunit S [Vibrio parahaemolyticus]|nr:restriction endonuclease subunit S [Vibrio parahaemolyticus]MDF4672404.1 restriction endonuclease subunit S [Vibrio parahaemolyticus]HAV1415224.1 restriction endonuclease subunit S [Vibrio parahaemolyticus]HAV2008025.1 restriction endonuclease subunit S [Vibrio parahaemolyticus]
MTEQMNVPTLRFSEFDGLWSQNKTPIKILAGNAYKQQEYTDNGYLLIQGLHIQPDKIELEESPKYVAVDGSKHLKIGFGDIVLGLNRPITNNQLKACRFYLKEESVLYQRAGKLKFDTAKLGTEFLYQYLRTPVFMKQLDLELIGSDQPYIKSDLFQATKNIFPTIVEQQKIASFLSKVDEKIALLTEKKDKLTEYKKGVMQQLFNGRWDEQDGQLIFIPPTLRFKADDGSEFPDWEINKLGTRTKKVGSGATPRGGEKAYSSDGVPFIRSQNVNNNKLLLDSIRFIPEHTDASMKRSRVEANDILLNITGASIGRSCVVPSDFVKGNLNQHVCIIRLVADSPYFVQSYLASYYGEKLIFQGMAGGGREGLNFESIRGFKLPFPSLGEQNKIATFLSAIDQKIDLANSELEKAKEWKKGLLQQMFV